jgi:hypothetical protein
MEIITSVLCTVSILCVMSIGFFSHVPCTHVHFYNKKSVYVDGTTHAADIDERDSTFMVEMAQRGYVAVTVDYGELHH